LATLSLGAAPRALPRRTVRWVRTRWGRARSDAIGAIGAAADAAGAVEERVIVELVCAQTGATNTNAAARAVPLKRCFIRTILLVNPTGVAGSWME
jgi:hypothetical protein